MQIKPFGVLGQEVMVDARLVVVAAQLGVRGNLEQVAIARHVAGQQQQVVVLFVELRVAAAHGAAVGRLVGLHADQGADPLPLAGAEELDRAVHDAMIGQRQGRLAEALGLLD